MSVILNPYLNFTGNAKEAMEFYRGVLGGELTLSNYASIGMGGPEEAEKILHGQLNTPAGLTLMGADSPNGMEPTSNGGIALSGDDADELRGYWERLKDGATVGEELAQAPWGDWFGMLTDRYGVPWMVNISGQAA